MNAYEEKQAARAERMRAKATKLRGEADARMEHDRKIAEVMNGTPVLIGHHSEKRHRRQLEKFRTNITKVVGARDEADALERRADSIEEGRAISSDDPDAVAKLRARLAEAHEASEAAKKGLATARRMMRANKDTTNAELLAAGVPRPVVSFFQTMGFLPNLTNGRAEERRLEARIAELERRSATPLRSATFPGGTVEETEDRVIIRHDQKPPQEVIAALRGRGFVWARSIGAWMRKRNEAAWHAATSVTEATKCA